MLAIFYAYGLFAQNPTFTKDVAPILQNALPGLPPSRRGRAIFSTHLRAGAPLGQGDQRSGARAQNAALVRRSALRQVLQRQFPPAERDRHPRRLGGRRRAARQSEGHAAAAPVRRRLGHSQARRRHRIANAIRNSSHRHHRISAHPDPRAVPRPTSGSSSPKRGPPTAPTCTTSSPSSASRARTG